MEVGKSMIMTPVAHDQTRPSVVSTLSMKSAGEVDLKFKQMIEQLRGCNSLVAAKRLNNKVSFRFVDHRTGGALTRVVDEMEQLFEIDNWKKQYRAEDGPGYSGLSRFTTEDIPFIIQLISENNCRTKLIESLSPEVREDPEFQKQVFMLAPFYFEGLRCKGEMSRDDIDFLCAKNSNVLTRIIHGA